MAKKKPKPIPQPVWWLVFFTAGVWFGKRHVLKQLEPPPPRTKFREDEIKDEGLILV